MKVFYCPFGSHKQVNNISAQTNLQKKYPTKKNSLSTAAKDSVDRISKSSVNILSWEEIITNGNRFYQNKEKCLIVI